jgi:hypothetical protein
LDVFDTTSERREHEFDFSLRLARELQTHGVEVNAPHATHVLRGRIVRVEEPRVVEGRLEEPVVGSFRIDLEFQVVNLASGNVRQSGVHPESACQLGNCFLFAQRCQRHLRLERCVVLPSVVFHFGRAPLQVGAEPKPTLTTGPKNGVRFS